MCFGVRGHAAVGLLPRRGWIATSALTRWCPPTGAGELPRSAPGEVAAGGEAERGHPPVGEAVLQGRDQPRRGHQLRVRRERGGEPRVVRKELGMRVAQEASPELHPGEGREGIARVHTPTGTAQARAGNPVSRVPGRRDEGRWVPTPPGPSTFQGRPRRPCAATGWSAACPWSASPGAGPARRRGPAGRAPSVLPRWAAGW